MDIKKTSLGEEKGEIDKGARVKGFLKELFFGALYGLWGYVLASLALPFGAYPFGIALLCASNRRVPYIFAGLCLAAVGGSSPVLLISVYAVCLLLRCIVLVALDPPWKKEENSGELTVGQLLPHLFSEHIALRMSVAAIGALAIGSYKLVAGKMTFYDMYGTIISVVAAPLAVLLVWGFFGKDKNKYFCLVSFLSLSFGIIYVLRDTRLYGVALGAAGCMFVTLLITRRGGTVIGIISGALLGLAVSLETAPLFAFAALAFGLLYSMSPTIAVGGALSVALAWGIYVQGLGVLSGLASALVCSALIFGMADKLFLTEKPKEEKPVRQEIQASAIAIDEPIQARLRDVKSSLCDIRDGFSEMSEVLGTLSEKMRAPSATDLRQICDNAFDSCCVSCECKPLCWGERYRQTSDSLVKICTCLQKKGSVDMGEVDIALLETCQRLPDIISEINHNTYLHTRELSECDRTEIFALDYSAIALFLERLCNEAESEYMPCIDLGRELQAALADCDGSELSVCVFGDRKKRISVFGESREVLVASRSRIYDILSDTCPFPIDGGELDAEAAVLRFNQREALSAISAKRSLCAEGEDKYCGDTSGVFRTHDGRLCAFISDGMGSGREAAITSGTVALFLRKFLSKQSLGGGSAEGVLKLLNGFLCSRGGSLNECSATVDLMELDLYGGRASFYKSGAAPTYIFRDGSLFKLRSHTVPMGIISQPDFRKIEFDVAKGDLVVMVSDGITDGKEECPRLFDLLRSQSPNSSPERIADQVIKYARSENSPDDLSVIVLRIA